MSQSLVYDGVITLGSDYLVVGVEKIVTSTSVKTPLFAIGTNQTITPPKI